MKFHVMLMIDGEQRDIHSGWRDTMAEIEAIAAFWSNNPDVTVEVES